MPGRSKRGFAAMSPEKQRAIASKGGQAAHQKGTAHEFTPEEARKAGRLGGKTVGENRAHMAAIGRKGGQRSASNSSRSARSYPPEERRERAAQEGEVRATDLLRADHRYINELFQQQETHPHQDQRRVALVYRICADLEAHAQVEEEIFYPAVKNQIAPSVAAQIDEGIEAHQRMKTLIAQLRHMAVDDAAFGSTVENLRECVLRHVRDEEEKVLSIVEDQGKEDLAKLGAQIQQRKQELAGNPPSHFAAASPPYSEEEPEESSQSQPHEFSIGTSN